MPESTGSDESAGGMKGWILDKYGSVGVSVCRETDSLLSLHFPKDFANLTEVVREAEDRFGSVCDLSYSDNGEPEISFYQRDAVAAPSGWLPMVAYIALTVLVGVAFFLMTWSPGPMQAW